MKLAKNKKSAFVNLFEVLSALSFDELEKFSSFLKEKRLVTSNNKFLELIVVLINKESVDTIDENEIKKQVERNGISSNFNKITENLYSRLLSFLSDLYKQDVRKEWQIESNLRLLEIEILMKRGLDSQAIAHLLKLEEKLKEKGDYFSWIYDDIGIYSRLASLKIQLSYRSKDLLEINEFDELLNNLLMLGKYFYINNFNIPDDTLLRDNKYIGYQILSEFFNKTEDYELAISAINNALYNVNSLEKDPKVVGLMHQYFNMIKIFIGAKHNNIIPYECESKFDLMPDITFVMLQEEIINSIKSSSNPFEQLLNEKDYKRYFVDKLFFAEVKIDCLPDRLELNRAILFYIRKDYSKCMEIIGCLKSIKKNKQIANPIFLQLLIIEFLCKIKEKEYDTNSVLKSMVSCLKVRCDLKFETEAIKIFKRYSKLTQSGRNEYPAESKDDISGLMKLKDITNPLHTLILMTLKNEV